MSKEIVRAADLTLRIFELVAFAQDPVGVTQVATEVKIAKSAAFKHLNTLSARGYIIQDPSSTRYHLGPKARLLARLAPDADDLATMAEPFMIETRNQTGHSVVLSTPMNDGAMVLTTVHNGQPIEIGVRPGSSLTLHASAQGKVVLAFGPRAAQAALDDGPLRALTPKTITDPDLLQTQIERIRINGYADAPEETLLGINTIAAPIFDHSGELAGCIGLVGSIQHLAAPARPEHYEPVQELARRVSRALGAR